MASQLPLLRRTSRTAVVLARDLLGNIKAQRLKPGDSLPSEATMAEQYGVGKGLLREAIRILEVHGFITVTTGAKGGARVAAAGPAEFGEMCTMFFQYADVRLESLLAARVALEPHIAQLAAQSQNGVRTDELIEVRDATLALDLDDDALYVDCSHRFHGTIARLSGNPILDLYLESINYIWSARVSGSLNPPNRRQKVADDHIEIANAIISGDPERAGQLMREHMEEFARHARTRHPGLMTDVLEWK